MTRGTWRISTVMLVAVIVAGPQTRSQTTAAPPALEELQRQIEELKQAHAADLEELRAQIEQLEQRLAAASRPANLTPQSANVFNPRLTVFGNFLGRFDNQTVMLDEGERIDNRFNLREVEIDLRAAIDPWADGFLIVAVEAEAPNQFTTGIEEGYLVLKKLPLLNTAPLGLKLKAGRYRPEFGRFNKIHLHDLPQTSYPRALTTFLGEEGFIQNGLSAQFFLPTPGTANTLEATLDLLNGGNLPIAAENAGDHLAGLAHLKWFWEPAAGHDLELGASGYWGKAGGGQGLHSRLYGFDLTYKWKPKARGEWHSFLLGGELYWTKYNLADDERPGRRPLGGYAWSQYQFNRRTYLGVRADFAEALGRSKQQTRAYAAFLSYYTTEYLRLRLGWEHVRSDLEGDGRNTAMLEINFVFGAHPAEPYWVNR
ncbi:MAG: hypothetical protein ONB48_14885 [candidate division KSB1 bacterium]|nr:hypothetical protein [candidate division KSB1 bacterium]MDZ7273476.1 hypothetical protein [candidate division KSB1 bacterium]MDZ7286932.1 hypothetical protein [candidate division KSB1 bacterium]MDZ7299715.1 hypothetical protein [candidate division KSB1 bacterium]MDZ7350708.1 hypothetical protein [candidate division KSB1 bacterium]